MKKIDKEEYQKRLDRITELFSGMVRHADELSHAIGVRTQNRFDECTAKFGCRNQRRPGEAGKLLLCAGDDKLNYRSAWGDRSGRGIRPLDKGQAVRWGRYLTTVRTRELRHGKTVFDYADELVVQVPTSCGRAGHCHECVVEITKGMDALCPRTEAESFLKGEFRLACQAEIQDIEADVAFSPLRKTPKILTRSNEKSVDLDPTVVRRGDFRLL